MHLLVCLRSGDDVTIDEVTLVVMMQLTVQHMITGLILGLRPTKERRRYILTTSLFARAQA